MPELPEPPVGLLVLLLRIDGARTLKDKRSVVKGILGRVSTRFRLSAAEVGLLDSPRQALLAMAAVAGEPGHVQQRLETVARFVQANFPVEIVERNLSRL